MLYLEFYSRLRKTFWLAERSDAARTAFRWGGGVLIDHQTATLNAFLRHYELREKDWELMNGRKNKGFVPNIKFVDLELTSEGKAAFKEWVFTEDDLISYIETQGNEGYKIGARYDSQNGSWIASLTCSKEGHANYGWCLSARGRSWVHAFMVLAYKDLVLLAGNWGVPAAADDNDAGWG